MEAVRYGNYKQEDSDMEIQAYIANSWFSTRNKKANRGPSEGGSGNWEGRKASQLRKAAKTTP